VLSDKAKFLMALGGVTLSIVLIIVVQSLYQGVRQETSSFIRALPGDLWVVRQGTTSLVLSDSQLPETAADDIRTVPGVMAVDSLYGRLLSFQVGDDQFGTYVMSLVPDDNLVRPEVKRMIPEPGTIIIDRGFAMEAGLSRGDVLEFHGDQLTVAEIRQVGNFLITKFAFVHHQDFDRLFGVPGTVNYLLVSLGPDATGSMVESIAQQVEGSSAFTTEEFASSASNELAAFLPIIRVITAIAFIVGLAVLSLTIYSATIERARDYAVLKAIGASPLVLYRVVLSQSLLISSVGFALGVGLAFVFNSIAADVVPEFVTHIRWQDVSLVLAVTAVMSFMASYLPLSRVARIDPAAVFRA
jgi:putative ABC transport system permease protein